VLTGNQTGALLLHYILSEKKAKGTLPKNGVVLKTIVTSEIGRDIASSFDLDTIDTLTGFKFIGEKINEYERTGQYEFQFGYEESYGYLIGDFARDKDAVQAALLSVEVAAYYKKKGLTLYQGLLEIFKEYGYYKEGLQSLTLKGKEGAEQIQSILQSFRSNPPTDIAGKKIVAIEDYHTSERQDIVAGTKETINLPGSNVLKYILEDHSWFCVRPSGTEPKAKFYFGVNSETLQQSEEQLSALEAGVMDKVNELIAALSK